MGESLNGRIALISGAAGGLGSAIARRLVAEGASVVLSDLDDDRGESAARELGPRARYIHHDVTDERHWESAVAFSTAEFGRLDILVNNAGVYRNTPLVNTPLEEYMEVIGINQVGTFLGMKTAAPALAAAGDASIINISSVAGLRGGIGKSGYASSKWAVRALTKVAASELAADGIRVNAILPGGLDTRMLDEVPGADAFRADPAATAPLGRVGRPDDIANLTVWLASDQAGYMTGAELTVDGGMTAL